MNKIIIITLFCKKYVDFLKTGKSIERKKLAALFKTDVIFNLKIELIKNFLKN